VEEKIENEEGKSRFKLGKNVRERRLNGEEEPKTAKESSNKK
jgi:hypothetical protein